MYNKDKPYKALNGMTQVRNQQNNNNKFKKKFHQYIITKNIKIKLHTNINKFNF